MSREAQGTNESLFTVGDQVRVRDEAETIFAGRDGVVSEGPDKSGGYIIAIGAATGLWFEAAELEAGAE